MKKVQQPTPQPKPLLDTFEMSDGTKLYASRIGSHDELPYFSYSESMSAWAKTEREALLLLAKKMRDSAERLNRYADEIENELWKEMNKDVQA